MTVFLPLLMFATVIAAQAQSFNSGSTGADGALELNTPGTIIFDPQSFNPPLNPSGDNVYHFTTIHVGSGVIVKLSAKPLNNPVFWLAQGPVQIDGSIDLNGADGASGPSLAGAGGYPGGAPHKPGYGPEEFTPNAFLIPLVGGSGGDGGEKLGGGAGGGALLIASSTSISVNGLLTADGGNSRDGFGGSGGAIRLVAPIIDGLSGFLSARGGKPQGADGRIRFETFDNRFAGSLNGTSFAQGKPFGLFLPPNPPPFVRVVSIGGVGVTNLRPAINQTSPVVIAVEVRFVPLGTVIQLELFPEEGPSRTVSTTPLTGTFELSRATVSVTVPGGLSRCYVKAAWKHRPLQ
jgi:hypothetical protein